MSIESLFELPKNFGLRKSTDGEVEELCFKEGKRYPEREITKEDEAQHFILICKRDYEMSLLEREASSLKPKGNADAIEDLDWQWKEIRGKRNYLIYRTKEAYGTDIKVEKQELIMGPLFKQWYAFWFNHFFGKLTIKDRREYVKAKENGEDVSRFLPGKDENWRDFEIFPSKQEFISYL
ncbi:MAG: hypothetical protein ACOX6Q_02725 [Candidatus Dojkabacteria bacterium]|jgi:hypothetical protein